MKTTENLHSLIDTVITRKDGKLNIDVYRKPTHTDIYLDYNSHHQHKNIKSAQLYCYRTLIHRALTLPNTEQLTNSNMLRMHYSNNIVAETKSTHSIGLSPEEIVGTFFKMVDPPSQQSTFMENGHRIDFEKWENIE